MRHRFDQAAVSYDDNAVARWLARRVAAFIGEPLSGRVLDVATGTGLVIEALIAAGSSATYVGVDFSRGMLDRASAKLRGRARFILADGSRLPFAGNAFDLVLCVSALPFFPDASIALREMSRVSRGGRLVFTAWAHDGLTLPVMIRRAASECGIHLDNPNATLGSEENIHELVARSGLSVRRLTTATHTEPLVVDDAGWRRVVAGEFGAPMRAADEQTQARARDRYLELLAQSVRDGGANRSHTYIVQT